VGIKHFCFSNINVKCLATSYQATFTYCHFLFWTKNRIYNVKGVKLEVSEQFTVGISNTVFMNVQQESRLKPVYTTLFST